MKILLFGASGPTGLQIARADVAHFIVGELERPAYRCGTAILSN
jgi:hypothetical protein